MKITVNNTLLDLFNGAKVRNAILNYYTQKWMALPKNLPVVEDAYGNELAYDGELSSGNTLVIRSANNKNALFSKLVFVLFATTLLVGCNISKKKNSCAQAGKEAVIFAVNDMHASIDNFPKLAFIVDSLRAIYPDMLLVAAGDNQTGNPVNDQHPEKGLPMIELMNAVGFDLSVVGNHEFDSRPKGFSNLTHKANFDFICANVSVQDSLNMVIHPYKIFTLPNGLKLAFLGLLDIGENGIPSSHPDNVRGFSFRLPFDVAPEYIHLKKDNDILIALTHLGFENDVLLAETMPKGIDLIIGGHSHTKVDKEQIHNNVMITQAERKLKYGTLIQLNACADGTLKRKMELIDIRNVKSEKPSVRAMVDVFNDNPVLKEVISTAMDDFSSYEELGYLMADAQRDAANADIALVNPGAVRIDHLPKGPISIMNVYQLDPFGNDLTVTELTGTEIRNLMLAAFSVDEELPIYPSGMKTKLQIENGSSLKNVALFAENGSPLDMNKSYSVAMNDFMTQVYKYQHSNPGQSLFVETAEATIDYLKKVQNVRSYRGEKRVEID